MANSSSDHAQRHRAIERLIKAGPFNGEDGTTRYTYAISFLDMLLDIGLIYFPPSKQFSKLVTSSPPP
jgi:hypothetical protein